MANGKSHDIVFISQDMDHDPMHRNLDRSGQEPAEDKLKNHVDGRDQQYAVNIDTGGQLVEIDQRKEIIDQSLESVPDNPIVAIRQDGNNIKSGKGTSEGTYVPQDTVDHIIDKTNAAGAIQISCYGRNAECP